MRRTTLFALVAVATAFAPMPVEESPPAVEEGPEAGNRRELRRRRRLPGKYRRTRAGLQPIGMWPDGSKARAKKQVHRVEESYEHYRRPHRGVDRMELQDDERAHAADAGVTETKVMFPPSSPPPSSPPSPPPSTPLAAPACDLTLPMQVFADVDDTTHSSGGEVNGGVKGRMAGSDPLYYPHVAYPGVAEFYLALSVGPSTVHDRLNPALLSARPEKTPLFSEKALAHDKEIIEKAQTKVDKNGEFYNYQDKRSTQKWTLNFGGSKGGDLGDFGWGGLLRLFGFKTDHVLEWYHKMGETKRKAILKFVDDIDGNTFEDACVVFVGDDGQGDCEAAAGMRMRLKSSGTFAMRAAFIHKLKTSDANKLNCMAKSYGEKGWSGGLRLETPAEEDGELEGPTYLPPIIYFDTYLDAAHAAFRMGLIQQQGLREVYTAVTKFNAVRDPHCEALPPLLRRGTHQAVLFHAWHACAVCPSHASPLSPPLLRHRKFARTKGHAKTK